MMGKIGTSFALPQLRSYQTSGEFGWPDRPQILISMTAKEDGVIFASLSNGTEDPKGTAGSSENEITVNRKRVAFAQGAYSSDASDKRQLGSSVAANLFVKKGDIIILKTKCTGEKATYTATMLYTSGDMDFLVQ